MRLFVALEVDDEARSAIAALQGRLQRELERGKDQRLKWIAAEQLHMTLSFLGEVPEARVPLVLEGMAVPLRARPFDLVFERVGVFPPSGPPRILWLGTSEGASAASAVYEQVAGRLVAMGFPREERAFHPHLTLARWRASRPDDRRRVAQIKAAGPVARVRIATAALFESRLSPRGSAYSVLVRAPLAED
jgi:2'-5' RNA ligase